MALAPAVALLCLSTAARGRTLAVLEYRAGVRGGDSVAAAMATSIQQLTSHQVITPADAQRIYGPDLQAAVAACKGDPGCIGEIGQRLGAEEVILVGLSQLGDLIVAIQRIEVGADGRVLARLADSISDRREIEGPVLVGYLRRLLPPDDFRRYGRIIVRTARAGDRVLLDGTRQGVAPLPPIRVPAPGRYAIRVKRRGHVDYVTRIDVLPDASVEVTPTLQRRVRVRPARWYERWWVWTIVGGVVAGSATAAALLASRPGPSSVEAVVRWPER